MISCNSVSTSISCNNIANYTMQTSSILQLFNNFTFATAAQSVLSALDQ